MFAQTRTAAHDAVLDQTVKQPTYQPIYTTNQLADHLQTQSVKQFNQSINQFNDTLTALPDTATKAINQPLNQAINQSINECTFVARAASPIDPLEREAREIERRRARLEDRRTRVLHAKTRLIGVDVNALDEQVRVKQSINQSNLEMERMYDSMRVAHAGQLTQLSHQQSINQSSERLALAFTHQQQAAEKKSRDQLNQSINQSVPKVETSFLSFAGEDLLYRERILTQQAEQNDWLSQSINERRLKDAELRKQDAEYEAQQQIYLAFQKDADLRKIQSINQSNAEFASANVELSRSKSVEKSRLSLLNQSINQCELLHTLNDPFLIEDSFSRDSNRGFCFKGFTQAARQSHFDDQRAQMLDLKARRLIDADEKRQYEDQQVGFQRQMILNDIAKRQAEINQSSVLREEQQRQAREKNARDQYLNAVVYTNPVKEEYFTQFGTSAR